MKLCCGPYGLVLLLGALALAGCSGAGRDTFGPAAATKLPPPSPTAAAIPSETPAPVAYPSETPASAAYPVTTSAPIAYPAGTPLPPEMPPVSPIPMGSETAPVGINPALLELAKQDLAQRLSVAADQITVVSAEYEDWPDSSLGCPQPGMAYSQVLTPGYRFILQYGQKQYDYHTGLKGTLVLCTNK